MENFQVTYDHEAYRPSTHDQLIEQKKFNVTIKAFSLNEAKDIFKRTYNKNPFYFKFKNL